MKILRHLILYAVILFVVVSAIGSYLGPDDLKKCQTAPSAEPGCQTADAIVAISGGDTAARTAEAIKLYRNGWAQILIFSGAAADKSGPSNAVVMKQEAINEGIDANRIVIEDQSTTTQENAAATKSIFDQYGIKSIILVTSAYHERRATLEFEKRAPNISVRSHPVATDQQWTKLWWITPTGWYLAVGELARIVTFYVTGAH